MGVGGMPWGGGSEWRLVTGLAEDALEGWNRSVMLPLDEEKFSMAASTEWMRRSWRLSFAFAAAYLALVYLAQRLMAHRPRYELRGPLLLWNVMLAGFSGLGCLRTYPEFAESLFGQGFRHSVCNASYTERTVTSYWAWLFALSKVVELGDTAFIVLRKQELIFLHYYHHVTVLIYTWFSFKEHTAPGRWFIVMNFSVHTLMYSYYAARALRMRFPRWVPMVITGWQLAQMVVGTFIGFYTWSAKGRGEDCAQTQANIRLSLAMYASYFLLFAHFAHKVYFAGGKFSKAAAATKGAEKEDAVDRNGFSASGDSLRRRPSHKVKAA